MFTITYFCRLCCSSCLLARRLARTDLEGGERPRMLILGRPDPGSSVMALASDTKRFTATASLANS